MLKIPNHAEHGKITICACSFVKMTSGNAAKVVLFRKRKNSTLTTRKKLCFCKKRHLKNIREIEARQRKKKMRFITLLLVINTVPRDRSIWMHPRTDEWFILADQFYTDTQWYENFRVSKRTFLFVAGLIKDDIKKKTTVMREPLPVQKRVAITYYYLATIAKYRNNSQFCSHLYANV